MIYVANGVEESDYYPGLLEEEIEEQAKVLYPHMLERAHQWVSMLDKQFMINSRVWKS
jgi:hypothetical protein